MARSQGFSCHALTILYGQRHRIEIEAAKKVAAALGVVGHRFVTVSLDEIGGSALTGDIAVPKDRDEVEMQAIPVTYVPARNTVMLAIALGLAEVLGASHLFIGVNAVDYSGYPDCRSEFIEAFERLAKLATKAGVEGAEMRIHAPLIHLSKVDIIREGLRLGVDYSLTHSCYDPSPEGIACGHCDSCVIRFKAFAALGMRDPALV